MKKVINVLFCFVKHGKTAPFAFLCCIFGIIFGSCASVYNEKMYIDVIGFNDVILPSYLPPPKKPKNTDVILPIPNVETNDGIPYDLPDQREEIKNVIDNIPIGQNTAAWYALDVGLDRVSSVNKEFMENDPDSRYFVVLITDGLDNASVDMARRTNRGANIDSWTAYGYRMQNRMKDIIKKYSFFNLIKSRSDTNVFQSLVLFLRGSDSEPFTEEELKIILNPFMASQNLPLNAQTQEIIFGNNPNELYDGFTNVFDSIFSFTVPKDYANQRIRMWLSADVCFEADLKMQIKYKYIFFKKQYVYTLENIKPSDGFTFKESMPMRSVISMDKEYDANSNLVQFTINDLKFNNKLFSVRSEDDVIQEYFDSRLGRYVANSEYNKSVWHRRNAYVLLLLDTSGSMGDAIKVRETANLIIDFLSGIKNGGE